MTKYLGRSRDESGGYVYMDKDGGLYGGDQRIYTDESKVAIYRIRGYYVNEDYLDPIPMEVVPVMDAIKADKEILNRLEITMHELLISLGS